MPEVRFISERDVKILLIDFSYTLDYNTIPPLVNQAAQLAQSNSGAGSLLTLLDLTGTKMNKELLSSLKGLSQKNGRYARATAFVGLNRFWKLLLTSMFQVRGKRNHKVFVGRTEAIKWLQSW